MKRYLVCLDPGHGGKDPGAVYNGLKEKDLVLTIAYFTAAYLHYDTVGLNKFKVDTFLTRTTDEYISLEERVMYANMDDADIFVSIHCNASINHEARGKEIFHYPNSKKGERLAKCIANYLYHISPTEFRGIKQRPYYVLNYTNMPAVLVEVEFIDYPETPLYDIETLRKAGLAIARGIVDYFLGG